MRKILLLVLIAFSQGVFAREYGPYMGIIPAPVSVKQMTGNFRITPETVILTDAPDSKAILFFEAYLKKQGLKLTITTMGSANGKYRQPKNVIVLSSVFKEALPAEGYALTVTEDRINLKGKDAGMFYGIQTLIQLWQKNDWGGAQIPCCIINDHPRFAYRGMHLDVARHFFDVNFVKKYLDVMAAYKLNNFHWHLTDDQGWRIEIKKYPRLTQVGSIRAQTKVGNHAGNDSDLYDNTPYGGYYTQEQIKEVVAYAADRYINVIPEIEMPGHSVAAITAYPQMSCDPGKAYKVRENWGVSKDVYCPSDTTFRILEDVLTEVMALFPGKYIHIGGDECPKDAWKQSAFCQQLIKDSSLGDEKGLQSYFIRHMERFINAHGRSIIGWDEILEGGLAPNATVMSWRGENGGIAAAQQNHDVVMTPGSGGVYFDHAQSKSPQEPLTIGGNAPLWKTYSYDPVPPALTPEQAKHIIGVQANLWTEFIATPAKAEYMLLPRMLALAEVAWSPKENKDFKDFSEQRLPHSLARLDASGYDYRVPTATGISDTVMNGATFRFDLRPPVEGANIYYTIDGYTPRETDLIYTAPLLFTIPEKKYMELQTIVITPSGKRSNVTVARMDNAGR